MTITEQKSVIRNSMRAIIRDMDASDRVSASQTITTRIESQPGFQQASLVLGFVPSRGEPDISGVLDTAVAQGKRIALPRCEQDGSMRFYEMKGDWRSNIARGSLSVYEPDAAYRQPLELPEACRTLVLVPALAYTPHRRRLGRGKGYYDRFFAQSCGEALCIGVCYAMQVQPTLPIEPHDMVVNLVITEHQMY
jgi:5-formyltetrahydrofolate cyclo-ligase